jgi:hypothetical protein
MSSPYQQNATIAEENTPIAKSTAQNKRPKNKIPRIEAKDLDELSKSWYPVQGVSSPASRLLSLQIANHFHGSPRESLSTTRSRSSTTAPTRLRERPA